MNFDIILKQLSEQFSVSTRIRESIPAERIYRDCPVSINHKNTTIDLVELDMVEFNVILVWTDFMGAMPQLIVDFE